MFNIIIIFLDRFMTNVMCVVVIVRRVPTAQANSNPRARCFKSGINAVCVVVQPPTATTV